MLLVGVLLWPAGLGAIIRDDAGLCPYAVQLMCLGSVQWLPLLRGQGGAAAGGLLLLAHLLMLDLLPLLEEDHRTFFGCAAGRDVGRFVVGAGRGVIVGGHATTVSDMGARHAAAGKVAVKHIQSGGGGGAATCQLLFAHLGERVKSV